MSLQTVKCVECDGKGRVTCTRCDGKKRIKKPIFREIRITDLKDIRDNCAPDRQWIFRGQPDTELATLLERFCKNFYYNLKKARDKEDLLLREFIRRYHQYATDIPKDGDILEWFSIMQHYGAPTRLLDFTYSISIASFVALEKATFKSKDEVKNFAIWAIDAKWAQGVCARLFKGTSNYKLFNGDPITQEIALKFEKAFMRNKPKRFVCPINPFRLNARLTIQKGIFMCPGDISLSFEGNLMQMKDYRKNVIKFVITMNRNQWKKALEKLYDENITRAVLFPGLDGFAMSLNGFPPKLLLPEKKSIRRGISEKE